MFTTSQFFAAAGTYFGDHQTIGLLVLAALLGVVAGALPGRWSLAAMALVASFTFNLGINKAFVLVIGVMIAAPFGRLARRLAGPDDAVVGAAPVAMGSGAKALGVLVLATWVALAAAAELLPGFEKVNVYIGSPTFASLLLLGAACAVVSPRERTLQALAVLALGIVLGMVGGQHGGGLAQWTFGWSYLKDGLAFTPAIVGLLFVPEVLMHLHRPGGTETDTAGAGSARPGIVSHIIRLGAGLEMIMLWLAPISGAFALLCFTYLIHGLIPWSGHGSGAAKVIVLDNYILWTGFAAGAIAAVAALGWLVLRRRNVSLLAPVARAAAAVVAPTEPDARHSFFRASAVALIVVMTPWAVMGAYQGTRTWGDLFVFAAAGAVGWGFRRQGIPRGPFAVGFVIGSMLQYLVTVTFERYGAYSTGGQYLAWMVLFGAGGTLVWGLFQQFRRASVPSPSQAAVPVGRERTIVLVLFGLAGIGLVLSALSFRAPAARVVTMLPGILFLLSCAGLLLLKFRQRAAGPAPAAADAPVVPAEGSGIAAVVAGWPEAARAWVLYLVWVVGGLLVLAVAGFIPAMVLFAIAFCRFAGRMSLPAIATVTVLMVAVSLLSLQGLHYSIPPSPITIPLLR